MLAACLCWLAMARTADFRIERRAPRGELAWLVAVLGAAGALALVFHKQQLWSKHWPQSSWLVVSSIWATAMALVVPACAAVAVPRRFGVSLLAGWIGGSAALFRFHYLWAANQYGGTSITPIIMFGLTLVALLAVTVLFARAGPRPEVNARTLGHMTDRVVEPEDDAVNCACVPQGRPSSQTTAEPVLVRFMTADPRLIVASFRRHGQITWAAAALLTVVGAAVPVLQAPVNAPAPTSTANASAPLEPDARSPTPGDRSPTGGGTSPVLTPPAAPTESTAASLTPSRAPPYTTPSERSTPSASSATASNREPSAPTTGDATGQFDRSCSAQLGPDRARRLGSGESCTAARRPEGRGSGRAA